MISFKVASATTRIFFTQTTVSIPCLTPMVLARFSGMVWKSKAPTLADLTLLSGNN